ncbi:hypothetical protein G7Y79_00018g045660 [Physcia stellaris]|nr:hypothetical protein G7Y79_00018g045660 [Physcia stellaris]
MSSYVIPRSSAACYFPNGTAKDNGTDRPCNASPGVQSMCCNLRNCRSDGLCIPYDNGHLWRGPCTDPTWKDPACLQLCVEGLSPDGSRWADLDAQVTTCADGTLCCGNYTTALPCCANGKGYVIQQGRVIKAQDATTSRTQSSAPIPRTSSISPSSTSVIPTPPPASKPSDTGVIVGGVVGGVAGVAALGLAFWYFMIRKRVKQSEPSQFDEPDKGRQQQVWQEPKEIPADIIRRELEATHTRQEIGDR